MKKIICGIFICLFALVSVNTIAWADDETPTVVMNDDSEEFVYFNGTAEDFGNSFKNMAPGDERTQNIILRNDKVTTLKIFFSVEVLEDLVDSNINGAVYFVTLSKDNKVFYQGILGGKDGSLKDLSDGSSDDMVLLTKLSKDEQTTVSMSLTMDGETMDNDYQGKMGKLQFTFAAEEYTETIPDDDPPFGPGTDNTPGPVVTPSATPDTTPEPDDTNSTISPTDNGTGNSSNNQNIDDDNVPKGNEPDDTKAGKNPKTGDMTRIGIYVGMLLASIGIIAAALYYNKKKQKRVEE